MMTRLMLALIRNLEKVVKWQIYGIALFLTFLIGFVDYYIVIDLSMSLFYVIPIVMVTWLIDQKNGFFFSAQWRYLVNRLSTYRDS